MEQREQVLVAPAQSKTRRLLVFTDIVDMYRHIVSLLSAVAVTDVECRRLLFDRQTTVNSLISLLAVACQRKSICQSFFMPLPPLGMS